MRLHGLSLQACFVSNSHLLKSELLTKQACRDKPCSLIFSNSMIYLRANVLSTVLRKYQKTNFYIINLDIFSCHGGMFEENCKWTVLGKEKLILCKGSS